MYRVIVRNTSKSSQVYETMGELVGDIIHHVLECGAAVLETECRVMKHITTKRSDDLGLKYVS